MTHHDLESEREKVSVLKFKVELKLKLWMDTFRAFQLIKIIKQIFFMSLYFIDEHFSLC